MPGANDAQKEAIRKAMAYSVDRTSLANDVYKGTYQPVVLDGPAGHQGRDDAVQGRVRHDAEQGQGGAGAAGGRRQDAGQR